MFLDVFRWKVSENVSLESFGESFDVSRCVSGKSFGRFTLFFSMDSRTLCREFRVKYFPEKNNNP